MATLQKRNQSKRWYLVYRDSTGRQRWKSTGTQDKRKAEEMLAAVNRLENARHLREMYREICADLGADVEGLLTPIADVPDLAASVEQRPLTRGLREKAGQVNQFLAWVDREHPEYTYVQELTEQLAGEYWKYLYDRGLAAGTRNRHLSALRSTWAAIRIQAGLGKNIWEAVQRAPERPLRYKALTFEQVQQLYHAAQESDTCMDETWWPGAIAMGFLTGLRQGDIAHLRKAEVTANEQFVELVPSKTANWGKGQLVHPANAKFLQWMDLEGPKEEYIWPIAAECKSTRRKKLAQEWNALCSKVGIKHYRRVKKEEHRLRRVKLVPFHSLRHTFVTLAIDRGADERDVQRAVGHANQTMTERYNHSRCLEAAQRVAAVMPTLS